MTVLFRSMFIDANHNFQFVKEDIEAWYKKLNNDGILIGHDFDYPNLPGIRKAVELEFKDNYNLEDTMFGGRKGDKNE